MKTRITFWWLVPLMGGKKVSYLQYRIKPLGDLWWINYTKLKKDQKDYKIHAPAEKQIWCFDMIFLIPSPDNCSSHIQAVSSPFFSRYLRIFVPRGIPALLPYSDQLHVRCCETVRSHVTGLHNLPVAATCRGGNRDAPVLRCSCTAQWAGVAARPAYPYWAAHRWQGTTPRGSGRICALFEIVRETIVFPQSGFCDALLLKLSSSCLFYS